MNIGYKDLGNPQQPGIHFANERAYEVGAIHIEQWLEDSSIRFNVTEFGPVKGRTRYILGGVFS